ncbi:MAG: Bax inhibitor-1 family protein [Acutalibacteraceae bacterium]
MLNKKSSIISDITARQTNSTISDSAYNAIIGGVLTWGFLLTAIICYFAKNFFVNFLTGGFLNLIIFIALYLVCTFSGSFISIKSNSPFISFLGFNIVVVPTGLLLSSLVYFYANVDIIKAIALTGLVSVLMMVLGTLFPKMFLKIGRTLFISLLVVIVAEILMMIFNFYSSTVELFIDGIVALIFSLYIAYDWSRAKMAPKTADNAVDVCVALYMDIINLFIRLLDIIASVKD